MKKKGEVRRIFKKKRRKNKKAITIMIVMMKVMATREGGRDLINEEEHGTKDL